MYKKLDVNSDSMRGYKTKLYPSDEQKEILNKQINLFRFIYNWGLNESNEYYKNIGKYIGKDELFKRLSNYRNENEWLKDIPLHSARLALAHLDFAFKKFFKGEAKHPRYKSKKYSKKCIHYRNEIYAFNFDKDSVRIPGLIKNDRILCKSHRNPMDVDRYYSCTITFDGIDYWLSVNAKYESDKEDISKSDKSIGIDLGIRNFAYLSDGSIYKAPKILKTLTNRERRQRSRLDKMKNRRILEARRAKTKLEEIPFTKNEQKLRIENTKTRIRMKNVKTSFLHQTTTEIVEKYPYRIVIEDLNITDMIHENKNNRDEVFHSMWYKFREYLTYKSKERGIDLVVADKTYPSSQICSVCGFIKKSSYHEYICPVCGLRTDRDFNAAMNLSNYIA